MNDDFLTQLQEAPRHEFSDALYARLARQRVDTHRSTTLRLATISILTVLVLFAIALTFSPAMRAATQRVIQTIGSLKFDVTDEYPQREGPVGILESQQVSLTQASESLPFAVRLPTWAPNGYRLEDTASVTSLPDDSVLVMVTWLGDQNRLFLEIFSSFETLTREDGVPVGPGSVEEVFVHNKPAGLVRGAWNANTRTWGWGTLISLHWTDGERGYRLIGMEEHVTAAELIQIAESMP